MMERTAARGAALANELRVVLAQVEELIGALGEDRDEALRHLRVRVTQAMAAARSRLTDLERQTHLKAHNAGHAARLYARRNPWTTLTVGAAVGLVLGALLAPQRHPRSPAAHE